METLLLELDNLWPTHREQDALPKLDGYSHPFEDSFMIGFNFSLFLLPIYTTSCFINYGTYIGCLLSSRNLYKSSLQMIFM